MKRSKKIIQPRWRPNFVIQSELPDIKVVRTNFLINIVAVSMALSMVFLLLSREYSARSLESAISSLERRIEDAATKDRKSLQLSGDFKKAAEYVIEVGQFSERLFRVHELVRELSSIKPDDLVYNSITVSESMGSGETANKVVYRVNLNGDAKNLSVLDAFKGILARAEAIQFPGYRIEIGETLEGRDERTGIFPYRLTLTFTPGASEESSGEDAS